MDNSGPAFPSRWTNEDSCNRMSPDGQVVPPEYTVTIPGMSLRDWFATNALPFCLREFGGNSDDMKQYAEAAYQIADAMLKERARR